MTEQSAPILGRRGRPRRFDHDTERSMLMDAAIRVMARTGYLDMSVSDVLAQAGVSTRSFYRHFDSKEVLLRAVLHREVDAVADALQRAVDTAPGPVEAVETWLDAMLDTFFKPKRAARSALFTAPGVRAGYPLAEELDEIHRTLARPLEKVLQAGARAGVLVSPNPSSDALTLFALVTTAGHSLRGNLRSRDTVRSHVMRFAWPALGLGEDGGTRRERPRRPASAPS